MGGGGRHILLYIPGGGKKKKKLIHKSGGPGTQCQEVGEKGRTTITTHLEKRRARSIWKTKEGGKRGQGKKLGGIGKESRVQGRERKRSGQMSEKRDQA